MDNQEHKGNDASVSAGRNPRWILPELFLAVGVAASSLLSHFQKPTAPVKSQAPVPITAVRFPGPENTEISAEAPKITEAKRSVREGDIRQRVVDGTLEQLQKAHEFQKTQATDTLNLAIKQVRSQINADEQAAIARIKESEQYQQTDAAFVSTIREMIPLYERQEKLAPGSEQYASISSEIRELETKRDSLMVELDEFKKSSVREYQNSERFLSHKSEQKALEKECRLKRKQYMIDNVLVPVMEEGGSMPRELLRSEIMKCDSSLKFCASAVALPLLNAAKSFELDGSIFSQPRATGMYAALAGVAPLNSMELHPDTKNTHAAARMTIGEGIIPKPGYIGLELRPDTSTATHVFIITGVHLNENGSVHVDRVDGSHFYALTSRNYDSLENFRIAYSDAVFVNPVDVLARLNPEVEIVRDVETPTLPGKPTAPSTSANMSEHPISASPQETSCVHSAASPNQGVTRSLRTR